MYPLILHAQYSMYVSSLHKHDYNLRYNFGAPGHNRQSKSIIRFLCTCEFLMAIVYANICSKLSKSVNPRETYNGTAYKYSFIVLCLHTCTSVEYINMLQPS